MKDLYIDIETYSGISIGDCGNYKYAMDDSFDILLFAYAIDDGPTQIIDLTSEEMPSHLIEALTDPSVTKHAHNAVFERVCLTMWLRRKGVLKADEWLDPYQWECSMIKAARCGLPLSLKQVGEALHLDAQKMKEGAALIQLFCCPRKAKKGTMFDLPERVDPSEYPDKWETFKQYCVRDVDVERAIIKACSWYEVSETEKRLYCIDQNINDRGVLIDMKMVGEAVKMDSLMDARLSQEAVTITGLSNPNSQAQLKQWLSDQLGEEVQSITKATMPDLMAKAKGKPTVKRMLQIRAEMGKTSNAKYGTMMDVAGADGRARGVTQFYGTRTGRWAGRMIQMQNLPQNHINALDGARKALCEGDYDLLDLSFGNVPDTLSQLIRTAFVAPEGKTLTICDFSAIEARVLAWMAGEEWVLDVFRSGGDIYSATASQMFHVPVEKHGQNAELRQKGKVAVLALGYQGGVGALDAMGGSRMGMTVEEEKETVIMWRKANPNIVAMWSMFERAAKECIVYKTSRVVESKNMRVTFTYQDNGTMTITLPSGRMICYPEAQFNFTRDWRPTGEVNTPVIKGQMKTFEVYEKPSLHPEKYIEDRDARVSFMGMNQTTKKWERIETYGGKITENITQAIARDCLAYTMALCEADGYPVVFHIHDELVMETEDTPEVLKTIQKIFSKTPDWAKGLPLKGAGYQSRYYLKD